MFKNILEKFSTPNRIELKSPIKNASNDLESCQEELKSSNNELESLDKKLRISNRSKRNYKELYDEAYDNLWKANNKIYLLLFTILSLLSFGINFENKKKIFNIIELITIFIVPILGSILVIISIINSIRYNIKNMKNSSYSIYKKKYENYKKKIISKRMLIIMLIILIIFLSLVFYTGLVNDNVISNKLLSDKIFKFSDNSLKFIKIVYFSLIIGAVIKIMSDSFIMDDKNEYWAYTKSYNFLIILLIVILLYTNLVEKNIINNIINKKILKTFTSILFIVKKISTPAIASYYYYNFILN